jgi:ATP-binding protein involved in chromosome partitioning
MGTSQKVADEYGCELLSRVPIEPDIRVGGDSGKPVTYYKPESQTAKRFHEAVDKIISFMDRINEEGRADNSAIQPTTPPGVSACSVR